MAKQAQVKKDDIPAVWSAEAADFINRVKIKYYKFILIFLKLSDFNNT